MDIEALGSRICQMISIIRAGKICYKKRKTTLERQSHARPPKPAP